MCVTQINTIPCTGIKTNARAELSVAANGKLGICTAEVSRLQYNHITENWIASFIASFMASFLSSYGFVHIQGVNKMQPTISILIPTHNSEAYIRRCLNSALGQTYKCFNIFVADDGSTDDTLAIIKEYASIYSNISYKAFAHAGLSITRNRLISYSTGEYFFFLDSDDFIIPETLQVLSDAAATYSAEIVQCEMERTNQDAIQDLSDKGFCFYTREEALRAYNRTPDGPRVMTAGKLYKREVFNGIRFPQSRLIHEDDYIAFLIYNQCTNFVIVRRKMYGYFINQNSIMLKPFSLKRYDGLGALQASIEFFKSVGLTEQVYRIQFRLLTYIRFLYIETALGLPDEKKRLDMLMSLYKQILPEVLSNIPLPDETHSNFKLWPIEPFETESLNYWEYVESGVLPA